VRVERLGLAEQRQDLGLVVGDGEVLLGKVALPGGQVVVGVVGGGDEVTGPDRLAQVVQAVPVTGSNRDRMVAARAAGDSRYSTVAAESVMDPPKPCIRW